MTDGPKKVKMKLVGADGNAFAIMGRFQGAARKAGWSKDEIKAVLDKATSGDYNNLLRTIMEHTHERSPSPRTPRESSSSLENLRRSIASAGGNAYTGRVNGAGGSSDNWDESKHPRDNDGKWTGK